MEQYPVPQFIDVEDKIIGPITTRQFVLLLIGGLIVFILYSILTFWAFVFGGLIDIAIFTSLAFVKINGRPVHFFLLNFIQTIKRPKLRVWNKEAYVRDVEVVKSEITEKTKKFVRKEPISGSRLDDLALTVNTGGVYHENM